MIQIAMDCRDVLIEEGFLVGLMNRSLTAMYLLRLRNTVPEKTSELHKRYVREIKQITEKIGGLRSECVCVRFTSFITTVFERI